MERSGIHVLVVEDDYVDQMNVQRMLRKVEDKEYVVEVCSSLAAAVDALARELPDVVLLDLHLPDSRGLETFQRLSIAARSVPVVLLTGLEDRAIALEAIKAGAQDFLVKDSTDGRLLARSIDYAIERARLQTEIKMLSLTDELTGLYNRRGFMELVAQQLKIHERHGRQLVLLFADVDRLKMINDQFGHAEGDLVLRRVAGVLKKSFRRSDVVARVGGDEFAALALETGEENVPIITDRIGKNLDAENARASKSYTMSLSFGFTLYDGQGRATTEALMSQADSSMYVRRRSRSIPPASSIRTDPQRQAFAEDGKCS